MVHYIKFFEIPISNLSNKLTEFLSYVATYQKLNNRERK
jgi:hypothetical protein